MCSFILLLFLHMQITHLLYFHRIFHFDTYQLLIFQNDTIFFSHIRPTFTVARIQKKKSFRQTAATKSTDIFVQMYPLLKRQSLTIPAHTFVTFNRHKNMAVLFFSFVSIHTYVCIYNTKRQTPIR